MKLGAIVRATRHWFSDTPERALDQAYKAALMIKAIEDEHFNGQRICAESAEHGDSVVFLFQADLKKYLKTAKKRLAEFRSSRSFLRTFNTKNNKIKINDQFNDIEGREKASIIIEKLDFIDEIVSKYETNNHHNSSVATIKFFQNPTEEQSQEVIPSDSNKLIKRNSGNQEISRPLKEKVRDTNRDTNIETVTDKTGVLPRSIIRTLNRIRREIDPKSEEAEEEVVGRFRQSRNKTAISVRFLLILMIVPLLTYQVSKNFLFKPLVENYFSQHAQVLFVNQDIEEEALIELQKFEETLRFKSLIGLAPEISQEERETAVKRKANEIAETYRHRGADGISNIFADVSSLFSFAGVIFISKREILVLKSFLDELVYGLSDSAKSFLIILFTDMFVGYHSPHGWEVILEGLSRHLGLSESREFNFLFIATFPVILDTVLKYWIFRYLNRISPSAVATYRSMNE